MTTQREWQDRVGQNWARSHILTDRAFAGITTQLLSAIADRPGRNVLDIGCGAGELSLRLACERGDAVVTGVDISPDLIAAAGERDTAGRCTFEVADALTWKPQARHDLLVSRHGVMFFDDPIRTFAHLRSIAAPGASLVFSCFRDLVDNPWATEPSGALGLSFTVEPGYKPGPFAFADRELAQEILSAAGWSEIRFTRADTTFVAGEGADAAEQATDFFTRIGPSAGAMAAMMPGVRADARQALYARMTELETGGRVAPAASIWLVTARA